MSDVHCAVCREPWDAYGVRHGDMLPWEAKLFMAGAGCPSCKGHAPEGSNPEDAALQQAKDLVLDVADDRPDDYAIVNQLGFEPAPRPPWARPKDAVLFACEGCGSAVVRDVDVAEVNVVHPRDTFFSSRSYVDGIKWEVFGQSPQADHAHHSDEWEDVLRDTIRERDARRAAGKVDELLPPEDRLIDGKFYCTSCAEVCDRCHNLTLSEGMFLPEGKYHRGDAVCEDCYAAIPSCEHCGSQWDTQAEADTCCAPESDEDEDEDEDEVAPPHE